MTDIVERLRNAASAWYEADATPEEAADEIERLRAALAQQRGEPVAYANKDDFGKFDMRVRSNCDHYHTEPLYAAPQQRQPLSDAEILRLADENSEKLKGGGELWHFDLFARAVEQAHGIGIKETK